ncbi:hypothetical protein [Roseateles albus]|uniref:Uncharacterized protein n=1 Tax=Roseateles albus TaxID=2987525 RepID=A0ABT5K8P2_9BURK|nr:hypothetical protein [Roseateles albus]MDC8770228.1 hypothetical protein [Roseateles albus]
MNAKKQTPRTPPLSSSESAAATQSPAADSLTLWRGIQAEVGDAACDGPHQCHSSAVGAKPCGGPDSYLAWSSKVTDPKKLQSLLEQHRAARLAENQSSGIVSNCAMVTDPGARCIPNPKGSGLVCVLNDRHSGGNAAI